MNVMSKKVGTSPGSMVYVGPKRDSRARAEYIRYDQENFVVEGIAPDEAAPDDGFNNLIIFYGVHDIEAVRAVGEKFDIHLLQMEDIVNTMHRPKLEWDGKDLFLIMKTCFLDNDSGQIEFEQISFFLSGSTLICFRQNTDVFFEKIKRRLEKKGSRIRTSGVDYLLYVLMDHFVDNYFTVLEQLGVEQDELQEAIVENPEQEHLEKIFQLRRDASNIRQTIWPLREILNQIQNREMDLLKDGTRPFFRDIYDHNLNIMDSLEMIREINTTLYEIYLSLISHRMNTVMKLLTIIATIFIPLTFVAGVYGMNFEYMPELSWKTGYFMCLGLMAAIGLGLAGFFKYKKWF
ncbi:MAG: magnesium and cobalt transport protein CorA [Desulfonatronovibrio sp. MSAO_Bac4]|nr:MAG: magnesium and cobalt transport protein CorA [Desulfonatronovibrio sp. MSAO_Bac4]